MIKKQATNLIVVFPIKIVLEEVRFFVLAPNKGRVQSIQSGRQPQARQRTRAVRFESVPVVHPDLVACKGKKLIK